MAIFSDSILLNIVGVIAAIFAIVYAHFQWTYRMWKRKKVPYFEPSFPYGNLQPLRKQIPQGEDVYNTVIKAKEQGWKYFGIFLIGKSFFVPLDLELIKCVLTKDFNHFVDRGSYYNDKDDPIAAHLFNVGGAKWRSLRIKLTPTFTSGKLRAMFQTLMDCSLVFEKFLNDHDTSQPIDIKHALACFTTNTIGSCAFGLECNTFKDPNSPFVMNGRRVFQFTKMEQVKAMMTLTFPKFSRTIGVVRIPKHVSKFYYDIVTKTVNYREKNNYSRNDFLQLLINTRKNNSESNSNDTSFTMNDIVSQCFVFFLAGFETSSTTMTFTLYELSIHPEIQEKVREELFRVLKKYDNKLNYESYKELEYMQQVLDESLRKYPSLAFITRQCTEDYEIPGTDITLDKGTNIMIPVKNIHYDENIYEDPETFDPERFSSENKSKRSAYTHMPFGEGPRICIGMRFGLLQSKIGLATILRHYRVKLNPKTQTPIQMDDKAFVTSIKGGLWLTLEKLQK